ncbi:MAG: glucosaminidase domain-containing protein [Maribacter sp.]
MNKKIILLLCLVISFASCKSKKSYADRLRTKNVLSEQRNKTTTSSEKKSDAVLPKEPSKFIVFKIESIPEYIETFAAAAQLEMKGYGIPASITLAQGLLESGYGKGELAMKTNNHFGIKCHTGWQGDYDFHDDDAKGECFRKYNHPMYSFRDHSVFLTTRSRYDFLFDLNNTDYKGWAKGLKKAGYATDPKYPQKLIYLIEKYNLNAYDTQVKKAGYDATTLVATESETTHTVQKGDTLYSLSKKYFVSVDELKQINNLRDASLSIGQELKVKGVNLNK